MANKKFSKPSKTDRYFGNDQSSKKFNSNFKQTAKKAFRTKKK